MIRHLLCITIVMMLVFVAEAQQRKEEPGRKNIIYFSFGSHRAFYTPGDIRLVSSGHSSYDFTLQDVKGRDDGGIRWETSPQYSYNIGYYSGKKKFGIEYQFDHVKYIMRQDQTVRLRGHINEDFLDKDTALHKDFVQLEHTDGANYAMLNFVKWKSLAANRKGTHALDLYLKLGAGLVIPKTNSTIMGKHYDDVYAISGYVVGVEPGIRYNFLKNFFASASVKGAYANYNRFRIAEGYGQQKWFSTQFNFWLGIQFPL